MRGEGVLRDALPDAFGLEDQACPVRVGAEPHAVDADHALWDWSWGTAACRVGQG